MDFYIKCMNIKTNKWYENVETAFRISILELVENVYSK
jgi:hypothetical protein